MDEKKWTKAIEYLKKACDKTTENVDKEDLVEFNRVKKKLNNTRLYEGRALKLLGLEQSDIATMTEKMKEAEAIFDSILDARELSDVTDWVAGEAMMEKGNCNWNLKKHGVAETCWLAATEMIPENAKVWYHLGDARMREDSASDALLFYDKSLLCGKTLHGYDGKGEAHRYLEEWIKAIECYDQILNRNDKYHKAFYAKAQCYAGMKEYTTAVTHWASFIDKFPKNRMVVRAHANKAWCENELGTAGDQKKFEDALETCKKGIEINIKYDESFANSDITLETGWMPVTEERMNKGKLSDIEYLFEEKAVALTELEQYPDAINCFKKILKGTKKDRFPLQRIIFCLGELGKIDEQKEYRRKLDHLDDDEDGLPASS